MKKNLFNSKALKKNYVWLVPPAVAVMTTIALSSCTKSSPVKAHTLSESDIQLEVSQARADIASGSVDKGNAELKAAAEKYARMGELLLMPDGFQYADEMFGKALELDPTNRKANLYKAITEPAMLGKGFIPRIERLLTKDSEVRDVEKLREEIATFQMPELSDFANNLPASEKAFISYYDVQRFERERLLPALKTALTRLEKIDLSSSPLKLNVIPDRFKPDPVRRETQYQYQNHWCDNTSGSWHCEDYNYSGKYGDPELPKVYFIDKYDLKVIQSSYSAMIAGIQVATAYSQKDMEFALRRMKALSHIRSRSKRGHMTAEDVTNLLREFPDLLTIEKDQELTEAGKNATAALKSALSFGDMKAELCDYSNKKRNAKNSVLFPICISASMVESLQMGVDLLAGPKEIVLGMDQNSHEVRIVIDVTRLLKNPPADLKALLPVSFDEDGIPVDYPDATMGGVFPNGDLIEKFKKVAGDDRARIDSAVKDLSRDIRGMKDRF
jgi:hypothetical protein